MPMPSPEAQREYQRLWVAARRAAFFDGKTCPCGSTDRLELHHLDKDQKVSHRIWSWSAARRAVEIAKFEILCRSCHVGEHWSPVPLPEHGTVARYRCRRAPCRCALCRAASTTRKTAEARTRRLRRAGNVSPAL